MQYNAGAAGIETAVRIWSSIVERRGRAHREFCTVRTPASQKPILLIEDDSEDADLFLRALEAAGIRNRVYLCADGEDAVRLLRGEGRYVGTPVQRPALIVLDLQLPGLDGAEVLRRIKGDPVLRAIPVVVLTTQDDEAAVASAYAEGANCFIRKPMTADATAATLRAVTDFWFELAELPG